MHPVIIQGVIAERSRHMQAQAVAARCALEVRRSRRFRRSLRARPARPSFMRVLRARRDPDSPARAAVAG